MLKKMHVCVAVFLMGVGLLTAALADNPPYRVNITLPEGFTRSMDPRLTGNGRNYHFRRPDSAALQLVMGSPELLRIDPNGPDLRVEAIQRMFGLLQQHQAAQTAGAPYALQGSQHAYMCIDWQGTNNGHDFAGFVCATTQDGNVILAEGQDLATRAASTLADLKDSIKAATYEKQ